MLKLYDFECQGCALIFEGLVEGVEGLPDICPACGSGTDFKKIPSTFALPTTIIPCYPGAKRLKAGYVHTHGDRPAEKAGSQVTVPKSMPVSKRTKKVK
jgi:putative FmdB family regulatory protein